MTGECEESSMAFIWLHGIAWGGCFVPGEPHLGTFRSSLLLGSS